MFGSVIKPKIFFVGFNKTGTRSLHFFMKLNGISSAHNTYRRFRILGTASSLAKRIKQNNDLKLPILTGLNHITAFSDLTYLDVDQVIEANAYFREFTSQYPDSYTILNLRPVEDWLVSRANHRDGWFLERYARATGLSPSDVLEAWRKQFYAHSEAVISYYKDSPRFMQFDISRDKPEQICDFLRKDYNIDQRHWGHFGIT